MSISIENFVKAIYVQSQFAEANSKPGTLAKLLNISNAAATDMARKLSAKELVNYTKYKELSLTPKGREKAINVIRKHRIWESFLYKVLNLSFHEIHREAEVLEHLTSDFLIDKIYDFLGKPATDPHGDPIPTKQGYVPDTDGILLSLAVSESTYEVIRLFGTDREFFEFCQDNHLTIGENLVVKKQYNKNKMTEIEINNTKILLNEDFTNAIFLKRLK